MLPPNTPVRDSELPGVAASCAARVPFGVGDEGAQFGPGPESAAGRQGWREGHLGQALGRAAVRRLDAVVAQVQLQLEVLGHRIDRAHADRGPGLGAGVALVALHQADQRAGQVGRHLPDQLVEDARALDVGTLQDVAGAADLDAGADAILHAELVVAAQHLVLQVHRRHRPAAMRAGTEASSLISVRSSCSVPSWLTLMPSYVMFWRVADDWLTLAIR